MTACDGDDAVRIRSGTLWVVHGYVVGTFRSVLLACTEMTGGPPIGVDCVRPTRKDLVLRRDQAGARRHLDRLSLLHGLDSTHLGLARLDAKAEKTKRILDGCDTKRRTNLTEFTEYGV